MSALVTLDLELESHGHDTRPEFDNLTRALLAEIQTDIKPDEAELRTEVAPPGTRTATAVTLGVLSLKLLPVMLGKLADLIISWVNRHPDKKVTIVIPKHKNRITIEYNPDKTDRSEIRRILADAVAATSARKGA